MLQYQHSPAIRNHMDLLCLVLLNFPRLRNLRTEDNIPHHQRNIWSFGVHEDLPRNSLLNFPLNLISQRCLLECLVRIPPSPRSVYCT